MLKHHKTRLYKEQGILPPSFLFENRARRFLTQAAAQISGQVVSWSYTKEQKEVSNETKSSCLQFLETGLQRQSEIMRCEPL